MSRPAADTGGGKGHPSAGPPWAGSAVRGRETGRINKRCFCEPADGKKGVTRGLPTPTACAERFIRGWRDSGHGRPRTTARAACCGSAAPQTAPMTAMPLNPRDAAVATRRAFSPPRATTVCPVCDRKRSQGPMVKGGRVVFFGNAVEDGAQENIVEPAVRRRDVCDPMKGRGQAAPRTRPTDPPEDFRAPLPLPFGKMNAFQIESGKQGPHGRGP